VSVQQVADNYDHLNEPAHDVQCARVQFAIEARSVMVLF
jgi:hypothetical protein